MTEAIIEAKPMGRVTVHVNLANNRDVQNAEIGAIPADQVRRGTLEGIVDTGANWLVLPVAVANQLGLPMARKITVRYADRRSAERDMADQVEVELLGRKGTVQAILEPDRTTALIGAIVLETLDLLVDCTTQKVYPRDPHGLTAEVEQRIMDHFSYRDRILTCEDVPVPALAEKYGTPLYVYSTKTLLHHLSQLQTAFAPAHPLICYSIKTNPNLAVCRLMAEHGAGFDVTSAGELYRAIKAGGTGSKMVFAGAGKTDAEIRMGLDNGVLLFNVESEGELLALGEIARAMGKVAQVALRVNPDLPPKTHAKTDTSVKGVKFGLDIDTVLEFAQKVVEHANVKIVGLHMHLGSPILQAEPYRQGMNKGLALIDTLRRQGHKIQYLNMGGGFGIHYRKQEALPASAFAEVILPGVQKAGCQLILEPGRFIVGNAGILVSRIIYTKESGGKHFVIQDGAMNDLIRPTLYDSFHRIWPVQPGTAFPAPPADYEAEIPGTQKVNVVGPICESGDFLAKGRALPPVQRGELLATFSAGAYGMAMSSNYNGRPRAAEVLVDGSTHRLVRRRETLEDLVRAEIEV